MKRIILSLCALACCIPAASGQSKQRDGRAGESGQKPDGSGRRVVKTGRAPRAIGPYSQAVIAGGFVYVSGQIGLDPKTGEMIAGGVAEQTEQVLRNLSAVLEAAGTSPDRVVKTTVFLTSMSDFTAMNEAYSRHFKTDPPARSTVEVARLPRNARVEIEAVAVMKRVE